MLANSFADAQFRKSSYSGGETNGCVEVGWTQLATGVRDSKQSESPIIALDPHAWRGFVAAVKTGLVMPA